MAHPLDPKSEPVTSLRRLASEQSLDGWVVHIDRRTDGEWRLRVMAPNHRSVLTNGEGWGSPDEDHPGRGGLTYATEMAARLFPQLPIHIHTGLGSVTVVPVDGG